MSSRVVLENDGAAYGKVTDNSSSSTGKRKSRDRETSRPIPSSRILKKNQRTKLDYEVGRSSGKCKSFKKEIFPSEPEQEEFSLMAFIYFRVMLAVVVLGKTKESYSTMWTTLTALCRVAEEISLLGDEKKKKKKMMTERERERKKLDNSEVKQQKR